MLNVIANPAAGGGRCGRTLGAVEAELARLGVRYRLEITASINHARELARATAASGQTAVAMGGDGLVAALAGELAGGDGVLGVLPGGRGNDFVRALGISLDPVEACGVLAAGRVQAVDLGSAGDARFVTIATCGFDSEANHIANQTRLRLGNLIYAYGGVRALASWRALDFELLLDGEPLRFTGYTVAVANTPMYGGGMRMAPDALLGDGLLDVVMVSDTSRWKFLRQLRAVFKGTHVSSPFVQIRRVREVKISASRRVTMYADGDPLVSLPTTVRLLPHALRVLVP